jgi:hypothetical protein
MIAHFFKFSVGLSLKGKIVNNTQNLEFNTSHHKSDWQNIQGKSEA